MKKLIWLTTQNVNVNHRNIFWYTRCQVYFPEACTLPLVAIEFEWDNETKFCLQINYSVPPLYTNVMYPWLNRMRDNHLLVIKKQPIATCTMLLHLFWKRQIYFQNCPSKCIQKFPLLFWRLAHTMYTAQSESLQTLTRKSQLLWMGTLWLSQIELKCAVVLLLFPMSSGFQREWCLLL